MLILNLIILLGSGSICPPHHYSEDPQEVVSPCIVNTDDGKKITLQLGMSYKEVVRKLGTSGSIMALSSQAYCSYVEHDLCLVFISNRLVSMRRLKWEWGS